MRRANQRNPEVNRAWEPFREPGMGKPLPEIVTGTIRFQSALGRLDAGGSVHATSRGKISPRSVTGSSDRFVMADDFGRGD